MKKINNPALIPAIRDSQSVLVTTHIQPDGDAIGSALALYHILLQKGKQVVVVCQDAIPPYLMYLPGAEQVIQPAQVHTPYDLVISVDASDLERLGECRRFLEEGKKTIQIDHHATNTQFADINEADAGVAASGMLVMRLAMDMGCHLTPDMATCLYAAISSDTGNFCFSSVTAETFEQMYQLMQVDFPFADSARRLHLMKSAGNVRLLGAALRSLRFIEAGRIAEMSLSIKDFEETGTTKEEADGLVNHGLYIEGVEMAYLATETLEGVKFSLRSIEPRKVSGVAVSFGGGGHAQAAGCMIKDTLPNALLKMEQAMLTELNA